MRAEQFVLPVLRQVNRRPRLAPVLDRVMAPFNPFARDLAASPYASYDRLRAKGPIFFHRVLNVWVVSSYELCEQILRSNVSVDRGDLFDSVSPWSKLSDGDRSTFTESLLLVDPPDHTRLRKLVARAFTPRTVAALEPRIAQIAEELVGKVADRQRVDLFESVFAPLPIYVIGELLGIPEDDWGLLKGWSDELAKAIDPIDAFVPAEMSRAIGELGAALDGWIAARGDGGGDDVLSVLVRAEEDGDRLSRAELRSMVGLLMTAGHETTSGLLGNAVVALDDQPELRRRLAEEPEVVPNAVEELLRFDSPVQNTDRMAIEDLELGGVTVKQGQWMMLMIGAANRDPERFERPDEVDFDRPDVRPLSFGHGIHHCVGAALARQEARTVLPLVARAFDGHRVDAGAIEWKRSMTLRGPVALPVAR